MRSMPGMRDARGVFVSLLNLDTQGRPNNCLLVPLCILSSLPVNININCPLLLVNMPSFRMKPLSIRNRLRERRSASSPTIQVAKLAQDAQTAYRPELLKGSLGEKPDQTLPVEVQFPLASSDSKQAIQVLESKSGRSKSS